MVSSSNALIGLAVIRETGKFLVAEKTDNKVYECELDVTGITTSQCEIFAFSPTSDTWDPNDVLVTVEGLSENRRIRHLPVVDEYGELVGIVSQRDVFHSGLMKAMGYGTHGRDQFIEMLMVKEVMTIDVVTTTEATPLGEAAALMLEQQELWSTAQVEKGQTGGSQNSGREVEFATMSVDDELDTPSLSVPFTALGFLTMEWRDGHLGLSARVGGMCRVYAQPGTTHT